VASTAQIRKLSIQRFRGIQSLTWLPAEGMNVILGGGDVGKTTVLEAIALLLSPSNTAVISEADYWARDSAQEFVIEAVMSLPDATGIGSQNTFAWPWAWNGKDAVAPSPEGEGDLPMPGEPVYRVRVRGTTELELAWEVMQPSEEFDHFSTAVRRRIGLVRMSADERNDRDLRLVYGSALDRLLADNALRARIGKQVAGLNLHDSLNDKGKEAIESLDGRMAGAALPSELKLGLTTSQGLSIGALIGLMATKNGVALPLSSWGAGTRRMTALEIASATDKEASVTLIDEIERGLEPYRLRKLINILAGQQGQGHIEKTDAILFEGRSANFASLSCQALPKASQITHHQPIERPDGPQCIVRSLKRILHVPQGHYDFLRHMVDQLPAMAGSLPAERVPRPRVLFLDAFDCSHSRS